MTQSRNVVPLLVGCAVVFAVTAEAQPTPNKPGALIDFPYVVVDTAAGVDTEVRLTNTGISGPVDMLCVYENANRHCGGAGAVCTSDAECPFPLPCIQGWQISDFQITLTPLQPAAFRASQGLVASTLPCSVFLPTCSYTAAGAVPPVAEDPFVGRLFCVAIDIPDFTPDTHPVSENVLRGSATVVRAQASPEYLDSASYAAIGFASTPGSNDGDLVLDLANEYEPCPAVDVVTHFFENADDPMSATSHIFTRLALAPCSRDPFFNVVPGSSTLEYLVFNEFEQRVMVKRSFTALQTLRLSEIDPMAWNVGLQGTLSGQTRIRSSSRNPVLAVAIEEREPTADPGHLRSAAFHASTFGSFDDAGGTVGPAGTAVCGNGAAEPGEECDDGNLADGDGCAANCLTEPCYICDPVCKPLAGYAPFGAPLCNLGDGSLSIKDNAKDQRDRLSWRYDGWTSATYSEGFDNPVLATDYTLCIFDGDQLALKLPVAHDDDCAGKSCWRETATGFRYRNAATNDGGVAVVKLKNEDLSASPAKEGFAVVDGKGLNLSLPGPVSATQYFADPVRSVLVKQAGQECWEVDHTSVGKNAPDRFSAP